MKYMGSKARLAKDLLPIILKNRIDDNHLYVEPFVGGANLIDKVNGNRWGNDSFKPTIDALIFIRDNINELPKTNLEFTKEDYYKVKIDLEHKLHGVAGFGYSNSGVYFNNWANSYDKNGKPRDHVAETYRNLVKQSPLLQNVKFTNFSYDELQIPNGSIIYCDPPYFGMRTYRKTTPFDYDKFWNWVRLMSETNEVFISEYNAPEDFETIFEKKLSNTLYNTLCKSESPKIATEKLFVYKG